MRFSLGVIAGHYHLSLDNKYEVGENWENYNSFCLLKKMECLHEKTIYLCLIAYKMVVPPYNLTGLTFYVNVEKDSRSSLGL